MNREEIMEVLPHREDMLLVDEIRNNEDGTVTGFYTVRGDEFFLRGHFPGNPIVPGVILCEMTAQSACGLFKDNMSDCLPVYTGINNVKFKRQVKPGDTITFKCNITRSKHPFYFIHGEASVEEQICMTGDFSFAIIEKN